MDVMDKLPALLLLSVLSAAIELIPIGDDNVTVPLAAVVLATFLLK
jgi:dolichol kinase